MATSSTPTLDDLQLRGHHRLFLGDVVTVSTDHGLVRMATNDFARMPVGATLTPDQADELARDLEAYAEAARREA